MGVENKLEEWLAYVKNDGLSVLKRIGTESFQEAYFHLDEHKTFMKELQQHTDKSIKKIDNKYYMTFTYAEDLFGFMKQYPGRIVLDKLYCFYNREKDVVSADVCLAYWAKRELETEILSSPLFALLEKLFEAEKHGLTVERNLNSFIVTDKEGRKVKVNCEFYSSEPNVGLKVVSMDEHKHYISEEFLRVLYTLWYSWTGTEMSKPRLREKFQDETTSMELFRQFGT